MPGSYLLSVTLSYARPLTAGGATSSNRTETGRGRRGRVGVGGLNMERADRIMF